MLIDTTTGPVLVCCFGVVLLIALLVRGRYGVRVSSAEERGLTVRMFTETEATTGD